MSVEQRTKLDLLINIKNAKVLGLTIPPTLLARADEAIDRALNSVKNRLGTCSRLFLMRWSYWRANRRKPSWSRGKQDSARHLGGAVQ